MSKRNFILLVIVLIVAGVLIYVFFAPQQGQNTPGYGTEGTNFLSRFNPFGKSKVVTPPAPTPVDISGDNQNPDNQIPAVVEKLKKIASMPIAGFEILKKERLLEIAPNQAIPEVKNTKKPTPPTTELVEATRYVDRAVGNIYQTFLDKIEERKFSTTVIPKIYEAVFGNKDNSVLMRYLKSDNTTIETFLGKIPKEVLGADTDTNEIKGSFLSDNITDFSISPEGTKMFYLVNVGDIAVGTVLNLIDNKKTQIFDSPFTEWLTSWPNTNMITLTTKPSYAVTGYTYTLNPSTKAFTRILSDIYGLTTLTSPNGKSILYGDSSLTLNIFDTTKKTSTPIALRTLPEKCTWGSASDVLYCAVPTQINPGQYPDSWYQGEISFNDQIWKVNILTGNTTILADPTTIATRESIDGTKLMVSPSEKYLLFVNKKDSFLWELELN